MNDCDRTLALLNAIEPWLDGGKEPDWFADYRKLQRIVFCTVGNSPVRDRAEAEHERSYGRRFSLMEIGISVVLKAATGVRPDSLDVAIGHVRGVIVETCGNGMGVREAVDGALDLAFGVEGDHEASSRALEALVAIGRKPEAVRGTEARL